MSALGIVLSLDAIDDLERTLLWTPYRGLPGVRAVIDAFGA
ncbi:MAG TPA: hypothetical protein VGF81_01920 [Solirubrobacteraceae bacterium]|jgi:hypothetical protein